MRTQCFLPLTALPPNTIDDLVVTVMDQLHLVENFASTWVPYFGPRDGELRTYVLFSKIAGRELFMHLGTIFWTKRWFVEDSCFVFINCS